MKAWKSNVIARKLKFWWWQRWWQCWWRRRWANGVWNGWLDIYHHHLGRSLSSCQWISSKLQQYMVKPCLLFLTSINLKTGDQECRRINLCRHIRSFFNIPTSKVVQYCFANNSFYLQRDDGEVFVYLKDNGPWWRISIISIIMTCWWKTVFGNRRFITVSRWASVHFFI